MRKLSILTITSLFPNPAQPAHGAFVNARLRELLGTGVVEAEVIAPVPWIPQGSNYRGSGRLADVPATEVVNGLVIHHPRYLVIPKVGMTVAPYLLYRTLLRKARHLISQGKKFDLIDAHYFYPDGVAATWLGKKLGLPVSVTARGTDLNLIPQYMLPRHMIQSAAKTADCLITVCQALKDTLVDLGTAPERVHVLRNGVDLAHFRPQNRDGARELYGLDTLTLLSVGLLIERKGHHHVIAALQKLPQARLLIAGDGPDRTKLEALAIKLGVQSRVRFLGLVSKADLPELYSAADILVLASSREGWANVLLEAMACGTPVVASAVWGTPEVVREQRAGVLMQSLDDQGVAEGVAALLADYPDHDATRRYAEQFGWAETTKGQLQLFTALQKPVAQTDSNSDRSFSRA